MVRHSACYQTFKRDVIAGLEENGFSLTSAEVDVWYRPWHETPRGQRVAETAEALHQLDEQIAELNRQERARNPEETS